jgi:hypothetical protein
MKLPFLGSCDDLITISLNPQFLTCTWMKSAQINAKNNNRWMLKNYHKIPLLNLEFEQSVPFNLTRIKQSIHEFITANDLKSAYAAIAISGPGIKEEFLTRSIAHPKREHFESEELKLNIWDYIYLYPMDHGQFAFYVTSISRQQVLQYQLLAISLQLNLLVLTTQSMALLQAYKYMQGTNFRHSQLGLDMIAHKNNMSNYFKDNITSHLLTISPTISVSLPDEMPYIASAFGLCVASNLNPMS